MSWKVGLESRFRIENNVKTTLENLYLYSYILLWGWFDQVFLFIDWSPNHI
jgi:hypothetical protein